MIPVTKPFLPPFETYQQMLDGIWKRNWLTNHGPLSLEFERELQLYLDNPFTAYCANGTVALQIAIKVLGIAGEVITTPFSYVATANSILWEQCKPVFVDIREDDFCINADLIEEKITEKTKAIMAVHVYGFPCEVKKIGQLARKHDLKVIYDGAHAFGVTMDGQSLLNQGDISTCSFHATKLFHTIEGGAIVSGESSVHEQVILHRQFGHQDDNYYSIGINAKNSEFHSAMGLCNLPYVPEIIARRKSLSQLYDEHLHLGTGLSRPFSTQKFDYNYAYYPVVFSSEQKLLEVKTLLNANNIFPRRYFYPSLSTLPFIDYQMCAIAESVAQRVLALPLFYDLDIQSVKKIAGIVNSAL